jgi:hypothetical protein
MNEEKLLKLGKRYLHMNQISSGAVRFATTFSGLDEIKTVSLDLKKYWQNINLPYSIVPDNANL